MEIDFLKNTHPRYYKCLLNRGITQCISILILDTLEIKELLNITHNEAEELKNLVSQKTMPEIRLGNVPETRLSTGCKQIDSLIYGGLPTARVIEVFGCAGSGKTQFCLQLLLTVQLPFYLGGLNKSAVYICTEPPFPSKRFHEMCKLAPAQFQIDKCDFENNVFIDICNDTDQFLTCINEKLPIFMEKHAIGLIIVDSITALFRGEEKEVDYIDRSKKFRDIVQKLRRLSMKSDAVLLFVNQVTDNPDTNETIAALGYSWLKYVLQKFQISRNEAFGITREFSIIKSNECEPTSVVFQITSTGIV